MTVSSTINTQTFVASPAQTTFIFTIPGFVTEWFTVTVDDIPVDDNDLTINLNANQFNNPGGSFTIALPVLIGGEVVQIRRASYKNLLQQQSYGRYSAFPSRAVERSLDIVTMGIQDLEDAFIGGVMGPPGPQGIQGPQGTPGSDGISELNAFCWMSKSGASLPALVDADDAIITTYNSLIQIPGNIGERILGNQATGLMLGLPDWVCMVRMQAVIEYEYVAGHSFYITPYLAESNTELKPDTPHTSVHGAQKVSTDSGRGSVIYYNYHAPFTFGEFETIGIRLVSTGTGTINAVLRSLQFSVQTIYRI